MDREPTVRDAARMLRDSVREYAKSKGWSPEQYRVLMNVQLPWMVISVVLFSEAFRRINSGQIQDEMDYYNQIMDRVEKDLEDFPEIIQATDLSLRPLEEYYLWGYRGSVEETIEIEDSFLNPELGPEHLRGPVGSKL